MTGESDTDEEYPSLGHALRSDAAINLYCGLKWVAWHLFHLMYVAFVTVAIVVVGTCIIAWEALSYVAAWLVHYIGAAYYGYARPPLARVASRFTSDESRKRIVTPLKGANQKSQKTPMLRRIYGHCPVSVKASPKWFEAISSRAGAVGKGVEERAPEKPTFGWVCDQCGCAQTDSWGLRSRGDKPDGCMEDCGWSERDDATFEWVRVVETGYKQYEAKE